MIITMNQTIIGQFFLSNDEELEVFSRSHTEYGNEFYWASAFNATEAGVGAGSPRPYFVPVSSPETRYINDLTLN